MGTLQRTNNWAPPCATLMLLGLIATHLQSQAWREVFNPHRVFTVHLEMDSSDWDRVRHDQPVENEAWAAEVAQGWFHAEGETPILVSVRRKGETDIPLPSAGNPQKVSLKIDFNEFAPGQSWRGLKKLSLENGSSDPLQEGFAWLAHHLADEAGIYGYDAANAGWVRLFINGELKGVFTNAEQRDKQFMKNHDLYSEGSSWLYKIDGSDKLEVGVGDSPAQLHLCYWPFHNDCPQPDLETDLDKWIDMRGMLTLGAVNAFLENNDALITHSGKNSFAVDFDPPQPRKRRYYPWDLDAGIKRGDRSITGSEPYQVEILDHPWWRQVYHQLFRELLHGALSVTNLHAQLDMMQAQVGPYFDEDPYVYGNDSSGAFDSIRDWVERRVPNVWSQLTEPFIERPTFNQDGGEVVAGFQLTMSAPAGSIYYTLDGNDPRLPGGGVHPSALLYDGPISIDATTPVVARAWDGALWCALSRQGIFNVAHHAGGLRITELMYHPPEEHDPGGEEFHEFLELQNQGSHPINLSGFYLEGVDYAFPSGTVLAPSEFFVLARDGLAFSNRYPGVAVQGIYRGKLANDGEKIRIRNADANTQVSVEYDDEPLWPLSPDGMGFSLVNIHPEGDPDQPVNWRASTNPLGSPGQPDPEPAYGVGVVINEVLAHTDPPYEDAIELYNPTGQDIDLSGWYLSDDFNRTNAATGFDLKKFRIPNGSVVAGGGYLVFYEHDFKEANPDIPFALSEWGDEVFLASADGGGNLTGYVDGMKFGASDRGVALGRYETSTGTDVTFLRKPTFGVEDPGSLAEFRAGTGEQNAAPKVGPVVISEIMYHPDDQGAEYIELHNLTDQEVLLDGWDIDGMNFIFPPGSAVAAAGYLLIVNTNDIEVGAFRAQHDVPAGVPVWGHGFVLENEGESLRLEHPNDTPLAPDILVDRVRYNDRSPWPTEADGEGPALERFVAADYGNDPVNWRTTAAGGSPGREGAFVSGIGIARESSWKFHARGHDLGGAWKEIGYSDSSWPDGDGLLGYGAAAVRTLIPYGHTTNKFVTTYFRKDFVIPEDPQSIANLLLRAHYDDGFILYLNGWEVLRSAGMPIGPVAFDTLAAEDHNSFGYETFDLSGHSGLLRQGGNVIAVELHQAAVDSDDLLWDAALAYAVSSRPTVATPNISPAGGTFTDPLAVTIATDTPEAEIFYTLDGTDPDMGSTQYVAPLAVAESTVIRARAYRAEYNASGVAVAPFVWMPRAIGFDQTSVTNVEASFVSHIPVVLNVVATNEVRVDYRITADTTASGEGVDFTLVNGTLVFLPGEVQADISLQIHDDDLKEPLEKIVIQLENPVRALLAPARVHMHYISDDESPLDSDGDGIPDDWEMRHGLDPSRAEDAGQDPDGDGAISLEEYVADTDPLDGQASFRIQSVRLDPAGIEFLSSPDRVYTLEVGVDPQLGMWNEVPSKTKVPGTGELLNWELPLEDAGGIFRVRVEVP